MGILMDAVLYHPDFCWECCPMPASALYPMWALTSANVVFYNWLILGYEG